VTITAVPAKRQIVGETWSLRAERVESLPGQEWQALIGVRRDLKLLVIWSEDAEEIEIEAWAGEPGETDGVALIDEGGGDLRLARIPLCSCGVRECGNIGIQLSTWLPAGRLPGLVDLLRDLPWTGTVPGRPNTTQVIEWPGPATGA
jgi:hypothetical protein